jgi:hypothetical protein
MKVKGDIVIKINKMIKLILKIAIELSMISSVQRIRKIF